MRKTSVSTSVNSEPGDGVEVAGPNQTTSSFRRATSCLESGTYRETKVGTKVILNAL